MLFRFKTVVLMHIKNENVHKQYVLLLKMVKDFVINKFFNKYFENVTLNFADNHCKISIVQDKHWYRNDMK